MAEASLSISGLDKLALLGLQDRHLRRVRTALGVEISTDGDTLRITGTDEAVRQATEAMERLKRVVEAKGRVDTASVEHLVQQAARSEPGRQMPTIEVFNPSRTIRPMTPGQAELVEAIDKHEIAFVIGPAGTGKTYLAVAKAVQALKRQLVRKIVLVRPAVEAGEKLGFLPGDMQAKINPYLRPLLDALGEMMDFETIKRYTEQDLIEMIPLAYMRGRTLNEAFIILDEAQNTTTAQMKMFLTRMGMGSRIVVSGDQTQVDLPGTVRSGLNDAVRRLDGIRGIAVVRLRGRDVVRHSLVQKIVSAYESAGPDDADDETEAVETAAS